MTFEASIYLRIQKKKKSICYQTLPISYIFSQAIGFNPLFTGRNFLQAIKPL